jgi:uncharacterized protein (DUF1810 family)
MNDDDRFNLNRFLTAQESDYSNVIRELRLGRKMGHWMWYVFPQCKGLGYSEISQFYGLSSLEEASEYLRHPVLGARLIACTEVVLGLPMSDSEEIFGSVDSLKFRSCMTLFDLVADDQHQFALALKKFFGGDRDKLTLDLCAPLKASNAKSQCQSGPP